MARLSALKEFVQGNQLNSADRFQRQLTRADDLNFRGATINQNMAAETLEAGLEPTRSGLTGQIDAQGNIIRKPTLQIEGGRIVPVPAGQSPSTPTLSQRTPQPSRFLEFFRINEPRQKPAQEAQAFAAGGVVQAAATGVAPPVVPVDDLVPVTQVNEIGLPVPTARPVPIPVQPAQPAQPRSDVELDAEFSPFGDTEFNAAGSRLNGGDLPENQTIDPEDGLPHSGSLNPRTGELLKSIVLPDGRPETQARLGQSTFFMTHFEELQPSDPARLPSRAYRDMGTDKIFYLPQGVAAPEGMVDVTDALTEVAILNEQAFRSPEATAIRNENVARAHQDQFVPPVVEVQEFAAGGSVSQFSGPAFRAAVGQPPIEQEVLARPVAPAPQPVAPTLPSFQPLAEVPVGDFNPAGDATNLIPVQAPVPADNRGVGAQIRTRLGDIFNVTPRRDRLAREAAGEDNIPAKLTEGEFVVNKEAAEANRPLLEQINSAGNAVAGRPDPVPVDLFRGRTEAIEQQAINDAVSPNIGVVDPFDPKRVISGASSAEEARQIMRNVEAVEGLEDAVLKDRQELVINDLATPEEAFGKFRLTNEEIVKRKSQLSGQLAQVAAVGAASTAGVNVRGQGLTNPEVRQAQEIDGAIRANAFARIGNTQDPLPENAADLSTAELKVIARTAEVNEDRRITAETYQTEILKDSREALDRLPTINAQISDTIDQIQQIPSVNNLGLLKLDAIQEAIQSTDNGIVRANADKFGLLGDFTDPVKLSQAINGFFKNLDFADERKEVEEAYTSRMLQRVDLLLAQEPNKNLESLQRQLQQLKAVQSGALLAIELRGKPPLAQEELNRRINEIHGLGTEAQLDRFPATIPAELSPETVDQDPNAFNANTDPFDVTAPVARARSAVTGAPKVTAAPKINITQPSRAPAQPNDRIGDKTAVVRDSKRVEPKSTATTGVQAFLDKKRNQQKEAGFSVAANDRANELVRTLDAGVDFGFTDSLIELIEAGADPDRVLESIDEQIEFEENRKTQRDVEKISSGVGRIVPSRESVVDALPFGSVLQDEPFEQLKVLREARERIIKATSSKKAKSAATGK